MTTETLEEYTHIDNLVDFAGAINPDSIVSRTVHKDANVKVTVFGFAAGQELTEHTATKPAMIHILSGTGRVTMGEDVHEVAEGAWFRMPPHLPHSLTAETDVVMLLIMLKG